MYKTPCFLVSDVDWPLSRSNQNIWWFDFFVCAVVTILAQVPLLANLTSSSYYFDCIIDRFFLSKSILLVFANDSNVLLSFLICRRWWWYYKFEMIKQYDTTEYRRSERRILQCRTWHKTFVFRLCSILVFFCLTNHSQEHSSVYAALDEQFGNWIEHFTRNKWQFSIIFLLVAVVDETTWS